MTRLLLLSFLAAAWTGCSKDDDNNSNTNTPTTPTVTVDSPLQINFVLSGTNISFNNTDSDVSAGYSNDENIVPSPDTSAVLFGAGLERTLSGSSSSFADFGLGTLRFVAPLDSAQFVAFFQPASLPFTDQAMQGAAFSYLDNTGEIWATDNGSMNQAGSVFTIQQMKYYVLGTEKHAKIKAVFNCKVYNSAGLSKNVTDGVAVLDFKVDF